MTTKPKVEETADHIEDDDQEVIGTTNNRSKGSNPEGKDKHFEPKGKDKHFDPKGKEKELDQSLFHATENIKGTQQKVRK